MAACLDRNFSRLPCRSIFTVTSTRLLPPGYGRWAPICMPVGRLATNVPRYAGRVSAPVHHLCHRTTILSNFIRGFWSAGTLVPSLDPGSVLAYLRTRPWSLPIVHTSGIAAASDRHCTRYFWLYPKDDRLTKLVCLARRGGLSVAAPTRLL